MSVPLLSTKFYVPPSRSGVVARPRLAERLLDGIGRSRCFTLLSGPAGSGKTTLLAHLIFSTRVDPPWPLGRYRVRNQLVELRARDLRFTLEETTAFFRHTMDLELSGEAVAALATRTGRPATGGDCAALAARPTRGKPPGSWGLCRGLYRQQSLRSRVSGRGSPETAA